MKPWRTMAVKPLAKGDDVKPWEVEIEVWGSKADRRWWWEMRRARDRDGPSVVARNTKPRKSRGAATAEARRVMKRMGLVEKAKAGKGGAGDA